MKAWITKYALTRGVYIADGEIECGNFLRVRHLRRNGGGYFRPGEWHETAEAAREAVVGLVQAKARNLDKVREKLNGILAALSDGHLPMNPRR
jgi:hypothetical protein